jgi:hypothetical protein
MAHLPVNKQTFSLTNTVSKAFNIAVSGFSYVTSLFFRVRNTINVDIIASFLASGVTAIRLRRVTLTTSTKLLGSQIQTISLRTVKLLLVLTVEGSEVLAIYLRKPILFVSSARVKLITTITQKLPLVLTPTLAVFYLLGFYDPDTLGTWDATTLGTMDYTT